MNPGSKISLSDREAKMEHDPDRGGIKIKEEEGVDNRVIKKEESDGDETSSQDIPLNDEGSSEYVAEGNEVRVDEKRPTGEEA